MAEDAQRFRAAKGWLSAVRDAKHSHEEWMILMQHGPRHVAELLELIARYAQSAKAQSTKIERQPQRAAPPLPEREISERLTNTFAEFLEAIQSAAGLRTPNEQETEYLAAKKL